ncbi:MAG: hypothetical protein AAB885_02255 [Patescibacteria group bacterium]
MAKWLKSNTCNFCRGREISQIYKNSHARHHFEKGTRRLRRASPQMMAFAYERREIPEAAGFGAVNGDEAVAPWRKSLFGRIVGFVRKIFGLG